MRLEWSVSAYEDRLAIFDYIEADNPHAAVAIDRTISGQSEVLTSFPHAGRPGRIQGTRELQIGRTPYVLVYRVDDDTVRVLRVLHGSRQWPE